MHVYTRRVQRALPVLLALLAGCGSTHAPDDAGARMDATSRDAHTPDAPDAPSVDASSFDAAPELDAPDALDAAVPDDHAEAPDAPDAILVDAPTLDGGPVDAAIVRTEVTREHPAATPIAPFAECTVVTYADMISGAEHRTPCSDIPYPHHPPTSGAHFSQWATFGAYDAPIPWGFLVHSMEHGGVVLAYHCESDADCTAIRAEYDALVAARGRDTLCRDEDFPQRIVVVPDPTLPVPIAVTAWGHAYLATCLDPTSLRAFVDAHYGMATEALCAPGVDLSEGGWCP